MKKPGHQWEFPKINVPDTDPKYYCSYYEDTHEKDPRIRMIYGSMGFKRSWDSGSPGAWLNCRLVAIFGPLDVGKLHF